MLSLPQTSGLAMRIRHKGDGQEVAVKPKEGAIFPLFSEMGTLR